VIGAAMFATLIIWTYILIFSYIFGWSIIDLFVKFLPIQRDLDSFSKALIILVGLIGINTLAAFLSLFLNLSWLAQIIFLLLGIALGWRMGKKHAILRSIDLASVSKLLLILFLFVFLTVLENGTHVPSNPDTGIYHAQAIRWIETYPAVPGLGNLHSRLAYNSNWLVINAFFSFSFLGLRSFHVLPGAFVLIALIYFLGGAQQLLRGKITTANVAKTIFIPLVFYTLGSQLSSPGTDFPASVGIWITFSVWLDSIEIKDKQHGKIELEEILVFFFSVYFLTVKLSTLPLLLLSGFILIRQAFRKDFRTSLGLLMLAVIILIPWSVRNLILSGYWIYPMPALSIFSPNWDWKIPLSSVTNEQRVILAWARIPRANIDQVLAKPLMEWLKEWFLNLTRNQRFLVAGAAFSPIFYAIASLLIPRKMPFFLYYTFAYLASYCGLLFWLFGAPDIRFGYGFVILTVLLAGVALLTWLLAKTSLRKIPVFSLISMIIIYQAFVLSASTDFKTLQARAILPADYASLATNSCSLHGYTLACAQYYDECFYDPFPCIPPGSANPRVEMRGSTLRCGFRYIRNP
jgi:hypothetical protein